ncbi:hypothetical protein H4R34_004890 [Dimargaris verticillata]|uniref:Isopenicillin N synthase-like Fe(2+) 2OG dioxygenase domain-containing protein n=1 Tax=Dimargaris verticillata TaxID=2761393 RepID=A0A9W8E6R3_9FUNG|nr:hypothetical protein H4R34_004890 [Dimargaris verticillata]
MSHFELPVVDAQPYLDNPQSARALLECQKASKTTAAESLREYGCMLIKDPRVSSDQNEEFLDMMEQYYAQPRNDLLKDERPEYGYQIGVSPEFTEDPRCRRDASCQKLIDGLKSEHKPLKIAQSDPKWRFFWRIGDPPTSTKFERLNAPPVVPASKRFPQWEEIMNGWGHSMHASGQLVSEMAAIGFGLPTDAFSRRTKYGPHLLAPTGSDLNKFGKLGQVLAGFHYDLNFLTLHGRSRYPGLYIWPRNLNAKIQVRVPKGCLLVQTGKQMEWLTGGEVPAGYHEVVVTEATQKAMQLNLDSGKSHPLWRVSSTFFLHIASDEVLQPIAPVFDQARNAPMYPSTLTGDYVKNELAGINLMRQYKD